MRAKYHLKEYSSLERKLRVLNLTVGWKNRFLHKISEASLVNICATVTFNIFDILSNNSLCIFRQNVNKHKFLLK